MKIIITRAKGITLDGKGYLVGINNIYVLEGSIFNFKYKKYAEKFVNKVLKQLEINKNLLEVMKKEYSNYLSIETKQNQQDILDKARSKYFNLYSFEENKLPLITSDKQLIDFIKENIEKFNVESLENYLYYCY